MMMSGMNPFPLLTATTTQHTTSETLDTPNKAWFEVQWQENMLDVLILNIQAGAFQNTSHFWILAETADIARAFFAAVSRWSAEIHSEVLVFDNGCWNKDEQLFQDIKNATFDNLILRGCLKQEILDDLMQFFASRALYEEHDVPWKRGILFVGPAGNGKTHTIKALINALDQPCLYVKSFRSPQTHGADEYNIRQVFDHARRNAPCVLILEDLDSLLTPQNRSFFLNELDGFASNIGIVTIATTNHPERLDPSILDRPSRFDRKYPFDLPELPERIAYIDMWNQSLRPDLRLSEEGRTRVSELTSGFSFAYLKELFLSSKMRWIANPQQGTMEQVMTEQVDKLREQMTNVNTVPMPETLEELQEAANAWFGPMMARGGFFQSRKAW
jgi:AAA+ superfamily predicted ATPase